MSGNTDIETSDTDFMEICASDGCLIAVDAHGKIQAASENTNLLLGQSPDDLLGADASDILLPDGESAATAIKRMGPVDDEVVSARCPRGSRTPLDLICHRSDDAVILEIVEPGGTDNTECPDISDDLKTIEKAPNSYSAAAMTVKSIRRLTGYDRSMVYRFLPDATGDVIAESREEKLTPYLGLRYPGSDIPVNARRLYLKTPIRIVADARSTPVAVKTLGGQACNLGLARLRSVSRYHIEYLQNMGVTATLVTSIIVDGSLWGLVACHHYSATMVTAEVQEKCSQLTRTLSRRIEALEQEETARLSGVVEQKTALFIEEMKMLQSLWFAALKFMAAPFKWATKSIAWDIVHPRQKLGKSSGISGLFTTARDRNPTRRFGPAPISNPSSAHSTARPRGWPMYESTPGQRSASCCTETK